MIPRSRWTAVAALAVLVAAGVGAAHPAGTVPGYTRLAQDCPDDYGALPHEPAHGLVTLDVVEGAVGGQPALTVRVSMEHQVASDLPAHLSEEIVLESPRRAGNDAVRTVVLSTADSDFAYLEGDAPVHVEGPLPVTDEGGDPDNHRFAYEVSYAYATLEVQTGETLSGFRVVSRWGASPLVWRLGDVMPGGLHSFLGLPAQEDCDDGAPDCADEPLATCVTPTYLVSQSDWQAPP